MFKSLIYFFQYFLIQKKTFQNQLKLPTASYRWNSRTNQVIYLANVSSVSTSYSSFFHYTSLKWNSLPLHMRDPRVRLHVFKSRIKIHLEKESNAVPIQEASTWRDFRFELTCVFLFFSKLLMKFEKTTYACISQLHLLYGKLSAVPLQ